ALDQRGVAVADRGVRGDAQEDAEEGLPLPALHPGVGAEDADFEAAERGEQVAEGGEIVQLEAQASAVDEEEVARQAQLQLRLPDQQRSGRGLHLVQRALHRDVLDRIELERAERRVEGEQERSTRLADEDLLFAPPAGRPGFVRHGGQSLSARAAALRTASSLSCWIR